MPTVRELKNRITFDVDKATVTNAENTFQNLKSSGGIVLSTIKSIGLAITGLVAASSKQFMDLEKDIGATNFYSRRKDDAEELLRLTKEIAKVSETTSQREAGQASAILSQIPGIERFRKELLPILEEISVANPKLDFTQVTDAFSQLVKEGNIDALKDLIPGSAELLEKLALSTFNFGDRTKTAANRTQLFLEQIQKVRPELKRLADEQRKTETFQFEGLTKETSDFFTNFGSSTAPAMTELFKEIRLTLRELNESEGFWTAVETASNALLAALKFITSSDFKDALAGSTKELLPTPIKALLKGKELISDIVSPEAKKEKSVFDPITSGISDFFSSKRKENEGRPRVTVDQLMRVEVAGTINVEATGTGNLDSRQLTTEVSNTLKESMRNIAAKNGRPVPTGGALGAAQ